jgi:hypothetical protein
MPSPEKPLPIMTMGSSRSPSLLAPFVRSTSFIALLYSKAASHALYPY